MRLHAAASEPDRPTHSSTLQFDGPQTGRSAICARLALLPDQPVVAADAHGVGLQAMEILRHRIASESGKGDVIGSGHIAQNGNGHSNGIRHKPNGGLTASDENMGPNMV